MEYLEGETLRKQMQSWAFASIALHRYAKQIIHGLARGTLRWDRSIEPRLKPENTL